jgi:hypothetical protein
MNGFWIAAGAASGMTIIAFSSEVDAGSREENASNQQSRASFLIQSEAKMLWAGLAAVIRHCALGPTPVRSW